MPRFASYCCHALLVLAAAVPACCIEEAPEKIARPLTAEQQVFWDDFLREEQLRRAAENHSVDFENAQRHFHDGRFVEALTAVRTHLAQHPHHQRGRDLLRDLVAVTSSGIHCTTKDLLPNRR